VLERERRKVDSKTGRRAPIGGPLFVAAVVAIGVSWFFLDFLVTDLGRVDIVFRFYDVWTLIDDPGLLLTGIGDGHGLRTATFGVLCVAAALAPLTSFIRDTRVTRLAALVPLIFMIGFGGVLYLKTSSDYFSTQAQSGSIGAQLVDLANSLTRRALGRIRERVEPAVGAYVSLLASGLLALLAIRGEILRQRSAV
jgi:hypothetical protein